MLAARKSHGELVVGTCLFLSVHLDGEFCIFIAEHQRHRHILRRGELDGSAAFDFQAGRVGHSVDSGSAFAAGVIAYHGEEVA